MQSPLQQPYSFVNWSAAEEHKSSFFNSSPLSSMSIAKLITTISWKTLFKRLPQKPSYYAQLLNQVGDDDDDDDDDDGDASDDDDDGGEDGRGDDVNAATAADEKSATNNRLLTPSIDSKASTTTTTTTAAAAATTTTTTIIITRATRRNRSKKRRYTPMICVDIVLGFACMLCFSIKRVVRLNLLGPFLTMLIELIIRGVYSSMYNELRSR